MKVFGIGLNETGTKTLRACLKRFGFNHRSLDRDLLIALKAGRPDEIFPVTDQYDSFDDWPYPLAYKELFLKYQPTAKFMLTERASPKIWLESLKKHSLGSNPERQCRHLVYGYDYPHGYEKEHLDFYNSHIADVESFFNKNNAQSSLLRICWESGDSWRELGDFLQLETPSIPLPHQNNSATKKPNAHRAENLARIEKQLRQLSDGDG